ncbi:molybdate ABC transporter permease subunit [Salipaludibacillus aurantiacus]|uniref:Molybdenum transport system permease n=1 Tax=Salipaludibacillus aurantiacus TaxID=1601833 RepID=A0A1H9X5X1_9BACI|nr:molybdate ABC transporter permease subunit [Salipaludibacillus aurantiacus]SES41545.1 molybdate transport system permease protein [Salipaludibacillus aurantiacus]
MDFQSFLSPVIISAQVILIASIISFTSALLIAWWMKGKSFKGRSVIETILMLPLVLPPTVIGFGLLVLMGRQSWIGQAFEWLFSMPLVFSFWAAVVAAAVVAFPLIYQTLINAFENVEEELEEAASQMGAKQSQVFLYVTLPLSWRSLVTGYMLGFARGLGEFGATIMFAGNIPGRTQTMPTAIYSSVQSGQTVLAYYWVASMILFSFLLLSVVHRLKR